MGFLASSPVQQQSFSVQFVRLSKCDYFQHPIAFGARSHRAETPVVDFSAKQAAPNCQILDIPPQEKSYETVQYPGHPLLWHHWLGLAYIREGLHLRNRCFGCKGEAQLSRPSSGLHSRISLFCCGPLLPLGVQFTRATANSRMCSSYHLAFKLIPPSSLCRNHHNG